MNTLLAITSVAALLTSIGSVLMTAYKRGQTDGRQTEILASLQRIVADHEARLRDLE